MIYKVFSVHDSAADAYLPPWFCRTVGEATRSFEEAANDVNHSFGRHPSDFTLFELGEFDDETGMISMLKTSSNLGKALDYVIRQEKLPLETKIREVL